MWRGVGLDLGVNFWSSLTVLLVFMAEVERMLFVASQRREREVLLEEAGESHSSWIRWSSESTAFWYFSMPSSDQITLVRTLSTFGATRLFEDSLMIVDSGRWNDETIKSWCESMVESSSLQWIFLTASGNWRDLEKMSLSRFESLLPFLTKWW